MNLLRKYEVCFRRTNNTLGTTVAVECKIVTFTEEPITYWPYRLSHAELEEVRNMVDELKGAKPRSIPIKDDKLKNVEENTMDVPVAKE